MAVANKKSPAKATSTKIQTPKNEAPKKVIYLKEGVTGKQMMKSIYKANNEHKKDLGSFSQCLKRAIEFGAKEFEATIKAFNVKDCTPKNLIPLRSAARIGKENFSVYEVLMLIKKFYQTK